MCGSGGASSRWQGITCADGRVAALNLSGLSASGPLDIVGPLTALTDLQLSGNNISGEAQQLPFCAFILLSTQAFTGLNSLAQIDLLILCAHALLLLSIPVPH